MGAHAWGGAFLNERSCMIASVKVYYSPVSNLAIVTVFWLICVWRIWETYLNGPLRELMFFLIAGLPLCLLMTLGIFARIETDEVGIHVKMWGRRRQAMPCVESLMITFCSLIPIGLCRPMSSTFWQ